MRPKSSLVPWLLAGLALTALTPSTSARRQRPAPGPRPAPAPAYVTVRCGPDIGAARSDAVLTFDDDKLALKNLRSVSLVKRERFTGARANDKCCETVVTTEGAAQTKEGARIAVAGRAELALEIGKTTKTCTLDLNTDQVSSFQCYPNVVKECPKSANSKVEVLLMVF